MTKFLKNNSTGVLIGITLILQVLTGSQEFLAVGDLVTVGDGQMRCSVLGEGLAMPAHLVKPALQGTPPAPGNPH